MRRVLIALGGLALLAGLAQPSLAAIPGQQDPPPLVLIALDSSGSMEYTEVEGVVPSCEAPIYKKNRWATAQEVLTGTWPAYTCSLDKRLVPSSREDYLYPIPHADYSFSDAQKPDGLIDIHADTIKFGFATFDTAFLSLDTAPGGWSFGPNVNATAALQGLGLSQINLGIRNIHAMNLHGSSTSFTGGGLVPFLPGTTDGPPATLRARARDVESAILGTIPFGGTPIAPMLEDIREYFKVDSGLNPLGSLGSCTSDQCGFCTDLAAQKTATPGVGESCCGTGSWSSLFAACDGADSSPVTTFGDPYHSCRARHVILITDGLPSMGEGDSYPTSVAAAEALYASYGGGVKIHVVGFNLEGAAGASVLDLVAAAGDPNNPDAKAYIANNSAELIFALSQVIGSILAGSNSRTEPTHTNSTNNSVDAQYQFNAAYSSVAFNQIDLSGHLDQNIYRCLDECQVDGVTGAQYCETFSISEKLNASTSSAPVYLIQETKLEKFEKKNTKITPDVLGVPNDGLFNTFQTPVTLLNLEPLWNDLLTAQILGTKQLGLSNDPNVRQLYRDQLIDLILADENSRRYGARMGAIYHGTPAILDKPKSGGAFIPSYALFRQKVIDRPTTLFVPTHLGELMAFQIDRPDTLQNLDYGQHLWSVIPGRIAPRLRENADRAVHLLDLTPVVKDVLLTTLGASGDPAKEADNWKSVLVQGFRNDRGFFALDVTNPSEKPQFLWEIDPEKRCFKSGNSSLCKSNLSPSSDYCHLGNTSSRPTIASVFLQNFGGIPQQERSVAIFGGGHTPYGASDPPINCAMHNNIPAAELGRVVYVTDLATGEIITEFRPGRGNVIGRSGSSSPGAVAKDMAHGMVGSPACFNTSLGAVATRCFIGDEGGQLWRLDMSSGDASKWTLSFFHDAYEALPGKARAPIADAPTLVLNGDTGLLTVVYGTGNIDLNSSLASDHAIYSLTEQIVLDDNGGVSNTGGIGAKVNWQKLFDDGTMVMGRPIVFDEIAYFTTFRPNPDDACVVAKDSSRLWGLHYRNTAGVNSTEPLAGMDLDGNPITTTDLVEYIALEPGVPFGVHIVQRPSCSGEVPLTGNSVPGSAGIDPGKIELVVQYQSVSQDASDKDSPGTGSGSGSGGSTAQATTTAIQTLKKPNTALTPISWALIFD